MTYLSILLIAVGVSLIGTAVMMVVEEVKHPRKDR